MSSGSSGSGMRASIPTKASNTTALAAIAMIVVDADHE
jgi:hypothetical protein